MARYVLDALNVIGARPGDWPADREAAVRRLAERAQAFAALTGDELVLVVDGTKIPGLPKQGAVRVVFARRGGPDAADDRVVEWLAADRDPTSIEVVTLDEDLRRRVRKLGARVGSPAALLDRFDRATAGSGG
jgi:predicted RNA-binding protein with PIN domain